MDKIIESFIASKHNEMDKCEDAIFINQDYIAVIDGVANKSNLLSNGLTGGKHAANTLLKALDEIPAKLNSYDALEYLNSSLTKEIEVFDKMLNKASIKATIIVYSAYSSELWVYGDCKYMINGKLGNTGKKIDDLLADLRSFVIKSELLSGKSVNEISEFDNGRSMILPFIKLQDAFENSDNDFGFPLLNGKNINFNLIDIIPLTKGDEVVIATDGYPQLKPSLKESEEQLNKVLKNDPLCYTLFKTTKGLYKENKSFDDRAYIRFIVD